MRRNEKSFLKSVQSRNGKTKHIPKVRKMGRSKCVGEKNKTPEISSATVNPNHEEKTKTPDDLIAS